MTDFARSVSPPTADTITATPGQSLRLSWLHPLGLIGLSFVNALLKLVTLGVYSFWGKTEVRRRIWSAVRLESEPLEYTGTGKELFVGFLIVFAILLVPLLLISFAVTLWAGPIGVPILQAVVYLAFTYLIGVGIYRAQRYRLSRTRWRGIRGSLVGNSFAYGWTYFWTLLLVPLTLGWIGPWRNTKLQSRLTEGMHFGNRPFRFSAPSGPLYGRYAVLWIGAIIIFLLAAAVIARLYQTIMMGRDPEAMQNLPPDTAFALVASTYLVLFVAFALYSIVAAWYRAGQFNHFAAHTHYEDARFVGSASASGLIWVSLTNAIITLLSLGILAPVAQARATRYFVEHLALEGSVPLADIMQSPDQGIKIGEGLAQAFDVDAF